ncbi:PREDICTED: protein STRICTOSIDINE SYNTHASE-LIKE 11-like [Ipomoea nil]|uniref:protein STRICTOSIDINE SYNTHASE-LIKE 11-like n=1 Tax=Ipomoea nil TaxID=35883 RepID=UPI0009016499|nr:PREDICTED: protein STRICTOSIDINE SYNTHASE-LIKE 11-like [Ipomoea nil]
MKSLTMFWISILMFISSPYVIHSQPGVDFPIILNLQHASGPEDTAIDPLDQGIYTGVTDGRILKYLNGNFNDFATTSPYRTKEKCDGINITNIRAECGRPLGLDFDHARGVLYVTDMFYGLLKVERNNGGLATQLAAGVNGRNFSFIDAVAVDELTADVYFIDAGDIFRSLNYTQIVQSGDTSGRLLKYSAAKGQVTVLLNGLSGPAGMATDIDQTFIMISEYIGRRIIKYFISGPKANTTQTVMENLEGYPDNVKRGTLGGFWVALNIPKPQQQPPPPIPMTDSIAVNFDMDGNIVNTKNVTDTFPNSFSGYQEYSDIAYVGSLLSDFVAVYTAI